MAEHRVRMMEPGDLIPVWRAARAQNRRDGTSYPVPPVYDLDEKSAGYAKLLPNVALALVTETRPSPERRWRVRMGHVFLRTIEEMSFGGGKLEMDFSGAHIPLAMEILRGKGYDDLHVLVPKARARGLRRLLQSHGLRRIDDKFAHWFGML